MQKNDSIAYIVEDDEILSVYLSKVLQSAGIVTQQFRSSGQFLSYVAPELRGCVLLDLNLPDFNGLEVQSSLAKANPQLPIIFMTAGAKVTEVVAALRAGAFEFFEKPVSPEMLIESVQRAFEYNQLAMRKHQETLANEKKAKRLTPRELEVLQLIADGHANKVIGMKLQISERTVETHRARIMAKMDVDNVVALVTVFAQCSKASAA